MTVEAAKVHLGAVFADAVESLDPETDYLDPVRDALQDALEGRSLHHMVATFSVWWKAPGCAATMIQVRSQYRAAWGSVDWGTWFNLEKRVRRYQSPEGDEVWCCSLPFRDPAQDEGFEGFDEWVIPRSQS